ncbi:MAG: hypothetical protein GXP31_09710 [Kiritimatiellaeota bacterium]|nr:hypothetical protein [Kiritimatiellota bacterium]
MRQAGIVLIALSVIAGVGYVAYVQFISGVAVGSYPLQDGPAPTVVQVDMTPEQSPVRLLVNIRCRRAALGLSKVRYEISFKDSAGKVLWTQKGSVGGSSFFQIGSSRRRRLSRSRYRSSSESVRVFDVPEKGAYTIECLLTESMGSFDSGKLTLRANVAPVNPRVLALYAGPGTLLGLLLLGLSFRKTREAGDSEFGDDTPEIEVGPDDAV